MTIIFLTVSMPMIKMNTYAAEEIQVELVKMRATAYKDTGNLTYTGKKGRIGIAAASKNQLGKTAIIFKRLPGDVLGEFIGIYEVEDTGSAKGITEGNVIDIWQPDMDACQEFMDLVYEDGCGGKVFVIFVDAQG